jgi:carbon-monoxide dehydrogenase small subunit
MSKVLMEISVNGVRREVAVKPSCTLTRLLRDELNLTGTHQGCGTGECGACTVLLDGKAVNSCLVLALDAAGSEITTVEGLARDGKLHPVQKAFIERGAIQCGFCTPGMMMTAVEFLGRVPRPTEAQAREAISGNLCRCTGYIKIIEAMTEAHRYA